MLSGELYLSESFVVDKSNQSFFPFSPLKVKPRANESNLTPIFKSVDGILNCDYSNAIEQFFTVLVF